MPCQLFIDDASEAFTRHDDAYAIIFAATASFSDAAPFARRCCRYAYDFERDMLLRARALYAPCCRCYASSRRRRAPLIYAPCLIALQVFFATLPSPCLMPLDSARRHGAAQKVL